MNLHQLGVQLIWVVGQVTVVLSIGLLLYFVARRRGPAMRSLFAAATLGTALGMTFLVLSPWPRWYNVSLAPTVESPPVDGTNEELLDEAKPQAGPDVEPDAADAVGGPPPAVAKRRPAEFENPRRAALAAFWQSLNDNLATPTGHVPPPPPERRWQWPAVVAVIFLGGIAVAIARLLVGLWAVARYRRSAQPIEDQPLLRELHELQASLGCRRAVTLCESSRIGTPATIGWRRPLVLLPADWREWNVIDRRAVLAHEVAHVARGDYLSGVVARLATALHFYHPLAHWLARRMRFEQELAADAHGVACSGGKESYVVALARMALAQDNRALAWAARPFLPSRSTFLRRIEMLRNSSRLEHAPYRPATRRLALAALAAVALFVAGLRGPIVSSTNQAEAQQPGANANGSRKLDLKGVPEDTVAYAVIRPAAILARDAKLREAIGTMDKAIDLRKNAGISLEEVEEFRFMAVAETGPGERLNISPIMILRTAKPQGWKGITDQWKDLEETQYNGHKYFRSKRGGDIARGMSYLVADDRTVVLSPEREETLRAFFGAMEGGGTPRWADEFKRVEGSDAALAVDVKFFGKLIEKEMQNAHGDQTMALAVAPIWRQANTIVAGAKVDGVIKAEVLAICKSEKAAEEVAATVTAIRVLAQNMLPVARAQVGKSQSPEIGKFETELLAQAEKFLTQVKPTIEGKVVTVQIEGTEAFGPLVAGLILPAAAKAREAAQRAQSVNNLKQIALAMYNYADVTRTDPLVGRFPAAAILGPDGKTPHSWRVAILPYLEQQQLYNQYKFNEPWDSENNKRVLNQIPPVFQHPTEQSTNSSYFVLTGKGGIFNDEPSKSGTNFGQMRDGTSNTLVVVEAKRDIPWTKPEDIPFDVEQELPKLGGYAREGFAAAFADGLVRFLASTIDPKLFKAMFTAAGGEVIDRQQLDAPGRQLPPPREAERQ